MVRRQAVRPDDSTAEKCKPECPDAFAVAGRQDPGHPLSSSRAITTRWIWLVPS